MKKKRIFIIPLLLILFFVPLFIRYATESDYPESLKYNEFLPEDAKYSFFNYYKSYILRYLALFSLLAVFIGGKIKKSPYLYFLIALAVFILIATIASPYPSVAVFGAPSLFEGVFTLISYLVICFSTFTLIKDKWGYKITLGTLLVSAGLISIIGVLEYFQVYIINTKFVQYLILPSELVTETSQLKNSLKNKVTATLYNPNYVGSFAAMLFFLPVVFFLNARKRIVYIVMLVLCILLFSLLLGCSSRAGMLACILTGIVLLIFYRKSLLQKLPRLLTLLGVFIILFIGMNSSTANGTLLSKYKLKTPQTATPEKKKKILRLEEKGDKLYISSGDTTLVLVGSGKTLKFTDENGKDAVASVKKLKNVKLLSFKDKKYKMFLFTFFKKYGYLVLKLNFNQQFSFDIVKTEKGFKTIYKGKLIDIVNSPENQFFTGKESLASHRGFILKYALPLLTERPVFGSGPDTFAIIFPNNNFLAKQNFWNPKHSVSKPHNIYLQIALQLGIPALLIFLFLMGYYLRESVKLYWNLRFSSFYENCGFACALAVLAYLLTGFFNDSIVGVAPVFWFLLGLGISTNLRLKQINKKLVN